MWSAGRSAATSSPSSGSGDGSADAPHQHFAQMLVRHSSGNRARRRYRLTLHLRCSCPANPAAATIAGWPRRPLSRLSPAAERASRTQLSPRHFRGLLLVTVSSHGPSDSPRQLSFGPAVTTDDSGLFHVPPTDLKIRCATHLIALTSHSQHTRAADMDLDLSGKCAADKDKCSSGWRDLNSRPLDPQIGPPRLSSVNQLPLVSMV